MSYPQAIQEILAALNSDDNDWRDIWYLYADANLTRLLCYSDGSDFIAMNGSDAYLFICNEQTGSWEVSHVGQPIYHIEPEMVGDGTVNFDDFLAELQHELPGVTVKRGSALSNASSEFVQQFNRELNRAFQNALDYCS